MLLTNKSKSRNFFHFDTIKTFVLIISGKFSGKLPTGIFNQLFEEIFDKGNYFSGNYD